VREGGPRGHTLFGVTRTPFAALVTRPWPSGRVVVAPRLVSCTPDLAVRLPPGSAAFRAWGAWTRLRRALAGRSWFFGITLNVAPAWVRHLRAERAAAILDQAPEPGLSQDPAL